MNISSVKIIACASFALLAFAGNSILCRLALGGASIDAASFTIIRLLSGVVVLAVILKMFNSNRQSPSKGSWFASFMLFLYALTFSFAYVSLDTGTGALILFGAVQLTMILASLFSGNKLHFFEWTGMAIAFIGFAYLVAPSLTSPSLTGFILMTISGIAWAFYTLRGRASINPISDTAYNFFRTVPFVIVLIAITFRGASLSEQGIFLAVLSGALASGAGYAVWYIALRGLSITQAAVIQLFVPVIAAIGGVIFANEIISLRLVVSTVMVLGGILTVVLGRYIFIHLSTSKK